MPQCFIALKFTSKHVSTLTSPFRSKYSRLSMVSLPISRGIVPPKQFPSSAKQVKRLSSPRKGGRSPESSLFEAEKVLRVVSAAMEDGRLPSKQLLLKFSSSSLANKPRLCGICAHHTFTGRAEYIRRSKGKEGMQAVAGGATGLRAEEVLAAAIK